MILSLLIAGCDIDRNEPGERQASAENGEEAPPIHHTPQPIDDYIEVSIDIRPIIASTNRLPGTLRHQDNYLTEGRGLFGGRGDRPSRALRVHGVYEPPGTRIVQLEIERGLPTDIFGDLRRAIGREGQLYIVDDQGNRYRPMGYIHQQRRGTIISLQPTSLINRIDEIPTLPAAGNERLRLLFRVTEGATITGFYYGEVQVGRCNLQAEGGRRRL